MFGNSSIWQRSGEIVIVFATLTALGALTRTASADPSWKDDRAEIAKDVASEKPAAIDTALPGMESAGFPAPQAAAPPVKSDAPAVAEASKNDLDPLDTLPFEAQDKAPAEGKLASPAATPSSEPVIASPLPAPAQPAETVASETPVAAPGAKSEAAPSAQPVVAADSQPQPQTESKPQVQAEAKPKAEAKPRQMEQVETAAAEPNVGIECLAGCYGAKPVALKPVALKSVAHKSVATKSRHVSLSARLTSRLAEAPRRKHSEKAPVMTAEAKPAAEVAEAPSMTPVSQFSGEAIWPKRHALCVANCPPEEKALTRAVYATVPQLRERINVAMPEAWLGVPLQQVATNESLTVTGAVRSSPLVATRAQFPGILRNFRSR